MYVIYYLCFKCVYVQELYKYTSKIFLFFRYFCFDHFFNCIFYFISSFFFVWFFKFSNYLLYLPKIFCKKKTQTEYKQQPSRLLTKYKSKIFQSLTLLPSSLSSLPSKRKREKIPLSTCVI